MAQWIRPRTLNREVPGSNLLAEAVVPLGKALYPHCIVPRKGLKAVGPMAACLYRQLAFLVARYNETHSKTPLRVKDDPEIGQLSADLTNNGIRLTQLWVIFRVRLTDFRVIVDPEWSLVPMDPFRVKFDPGVFRV